MNFTNTDAPKLKIAVLVSGGGTNLQALIDAQKNGVLKSGVIDIVISSKPNAYALERASDAGIASAVVDRREHPDRREFTEKIAGILGGRGVGLVVLAGFMCILDEYIFTEYENRVINVHPALIPSFCGDGYYGLAVHRAALERGVKLTGATVHFVNGVTDGGPIIMQKAVEVRDGDTPELLQKRVMTEAEHIILPEAAELFCAGRLTVDGAWVRIAEG